MNKLKELSKELASLKEKRQHLINERERSRREIEMVLRDAAQLVLGDVDISKLADKTHHLDFAIDANIEAVKFLDAKINVAQALFDGEQAAQDSEDRERIAQLEREQALYYR